jgi:hypothetical protein
VRNRDQGRQAQPLVRKTKQSSTPFLDYKKVWEGFFVLNQKEKNRFVALFLVDELLDY